MNRILLASTFLFCACTGCEDAPHYVADSLPQSESSDELVSSEGRGNYNWNIDEDGQFAVPRPNAFGFLNAMRGKVKNTQVYPQDSTTLWQRPEWMNDEVYALFSRFALPATTHKLLEVPASRIRNRLAYYLDQSGQWLYWLEDNQIRFCEVSKPEEIQSIESPLAGSVGILANIANDRVYVCNSNAAVCVSLEDGTEVSRIELPDAIQHWERATAKDCIIAISRDRELFVIDEKMQSIRRFKEPIANVNVGVHPNGEFLLANTGNGLVQWNFGQASGDSGDASEMVEPNVDSQQMDVSSLFAVPGIQDTLLIDDLHLKFEFNPLNYVGGFDGMWKPFVSYSLFDTHVVQCSEAESNWFLMYGAFADEIQPDGKTSASKYVLLDVLAHSSDLQYSKHVDLGTKNLLRLIPDKVGETLAIYDPDGLRVLSRNRWPSSLDSAATYSLAMNLIKAGEFQALERCAEELRSKDWPHQRLWGEQAYAKFANTISQALIRLSNKQNAVPTDTSKWIEDGSELAAVIEMLMIHNDAFAKNQKRVSQGKKPGSPTEFPPTTQRLEKLLESPKAPAIAYSLKLQNMRIKGEPISAAEPILLRCIELHPEYWNIHIQVANWFKSENGGYPGNVHDYVDYVASVYPSDIQDAAYMAIMSQLLRENGEEILRRKDEFVDRQRMLRTFKKWAVQMDDPKDAAVSLRAVFDTEYQRIMFPLAERFARTVPIFDNMVGNRDIGFDRLSNLLDMVKRRILGK